MTHFLRSVIAVICCVFIFLNDSEAQTTGVGKISGRITDRKTGETVIGATVKIENSSAAGASDVEGRYVLNSLPAGKYTVTVSYLGYQSKAVSDVLVRVGIVTQLDITLDEANTQQLQEVVVRATFKQESVNSLYAAQKTSPRMSDGITADVIKRSPDRNTGEVLKRVSGATIQENKFLTVRGLSDRYNNTLLNNTTLPSSEPDRRAFSFDIIPSNLIDQIIVNKTGTPDLPGEFAGGIIQLKTKDFPDQKTIEINYSAGYNTISTFKDFKGSQRGKYDFLGFDDGTRELPSSFPSTANRFINLSTQQKIDVTKDFRNSWRVRNQGTTLPPQSLQFIYGNSKQFKNDSKLGGLFSLSYRNQQVQNDRQRYDFFETDASGRGANLFDYSDKIYKNLVNIGALANIAYSYKRNKFVLKNIYNRVFEDSYTDRKGIAYEYPYAQINTEYQLTEKSLLNSILEGEHVFGKRNAKIDWNLFYNNTVQNQPDIRRIYYSKDLSQINNDAVPYFANVPSGSGSPRNAGRYYLNLNENIYGGQLNYTHPFKINDVQQSVKIGAWKQYKDRNFDGRLLGYVITDPSQFDLTKLTLPQANIFSDSNIALNGFRIDDITDPSGQYDATGDLTAGYLMLNNEFLKKFKLSWGARIENYLEELTTVASRTSVTDNKYTDILPSANLTYAINDKTNLRAAYSKTVARAEFRELAPFSFFNFKDGIVDVGNPNLTRTRIDNIDLRAEFYPSSGQIISGSLFYKNLDKPIEMVFNPSSTSLSKTRTYLNAPQATLYGFEIEIREKLGFLGSSEWLNNLTAYTNFTFIKSEVEFDRNLNGNIQDRRRLQGQSPYIINGGLQYLEPQGDFSINLLYNRIGPRINTVGYGNYINNDFVFSYNDIIEKSRDVIDLQLGKRILKRRGELKLNIGDILNQKAILYQDLNQNKRYDSVNDQRIESVTLGTNFTLLFNYKF